mmetsp:Transcript_69885/g.158593  ORF Transcript_69885/g.158593 Transcript_69885/m.158593 type:complete len:479 (-) Transcript_69885:13-1449(-)
MPVASERRAGAKQTGPGTLEAAEGRLWPDDRGVFVLIRRCRRALSTDGNAVVEEDVVVEHELVEEYLVALHGLKLLALQRPVLWLGIEHAAPQWEVGLVLHALNAARLLLLQLLPLAVGLSLVRLVGNASHPARKELLGFAHRVLAGNLVAHEVQLRHTQPWDDVPVVHDRCEDLFHLLVGGDGLRYNAGCGEAHALHGGKAEASGPLFGGGVQQQRDHRSGTRPQGVAAHYQVILRVAHRGLDHLLLDVVEEPLGGLQHPLVHCATQEVGVLHRVRGSVSQRILHGERPPDADDRAPVLVVEEAGMRRAQGLTVHAGLDHVLLLQAEHLQHGPRVRAVVLVGERAASGRGLHIDEVGCVVHVALEHLLPVAGPCKPVGVSELRQLLLTELVRLEGIHGLLEEIDVLVPQGPPCRHVHQRHDLQGIPLLQVVEEDHDGLLEGLVLALRPALHGSHGGCHRGNSRMPRPCPLPARRSPP